MSDAPTQAPTRPADDLGNMREQGIRHLIASRHNDACRQAVGLDAALRVLESWGLLHGKAH